MLIPLASDFRQPLHFVVHNLGYSNQAVLAGACENEGVFLIQEVGVQQAAFWRGAVKGG